MFQYDYKIRLLLIIIIIAMISTIFLIIQQQCTLVGVDDFNWNNGVQSGFVVLAQQSISYNNNNNNNKYTFNYINNESRRRRRRRSSRRIPGRQQQQPRQTLPLDASKSSKQQQQQQSSSSSSSTPPFTISNMTCSYITQPLNHFDLPKNRSGTYEQRYCYYNNFIKQDGGNELNNTSPVLFYIGNESPIETYMNHTGFMWEFGLEIQAQIIFLEHRYEGRSLPNPTIPNCMAYSSSIQALADAANFIEMIVFRNNTNDNYNYNYKYQYHKRPVIVFGGSYGGMLASWLRILYPSIVIGAIAASAPIFGLPIPITSYEQTTIQVNDEGRSIDNIVSNTTTTNTTTTTVIDSAFKIISYGLQQPYPPTTKNYNTVTNHCSNNLLSVFPLIVILSQHEIGRQLLQDSFRFCHPLVLLLPPNNNNNNNNDESTTTVIAEKIIDWIQSPWFDYAEGSYPYPSSYILYALTHNENVQLPAWPLQSACWMNSTLYSNDMGIIINGDVSNVTYSITYGDSNLTLHIDWDEITVQLPSNTISIDDFLLDIVNQQSLSDLHNIDNKNNNMNTVNTISSLLMNVRDAVGVWYNASLDIQCYDVDSDAPNDANENENGDYDNNWDIHVPYESAMEATSRLLTYNSNDDKKNVTMLCYNKMKQEGSWPSLYCNEGMDLIITYASGIGNDCFWPPTVPRNVRTYEQLVNGTSPIINVVDPCIDPDGIYGYPQQPRDIWSTWYDIVYGGKNIFDYASNVVFTNGRLDPWSAAGVVPNLKPEFASKLNIDHDFDLPVYNDSILSYNAVPGLTVQYMNPTILSVMMDYGGHHTDLMYSQPKLDPLCVQYTRLLERTIIAQWIDDFWKTNSEK